MPYSSGAPRVGDEVGLGRTGHDKAAYQLRLKNDAPSPKRETLNRSCDEEDEARWAADGEAQASADGHGVVP